MKKVLMATVAVAPVLYSGSSAALFVPNNQQSTLTPSVSSGLTPRAQQDHVKTLSDGVSASVGGAFADGGVSDSTLGYQMGGGSSDAERATGHALAISGYDSMESGGMDFYWNVWSSVRWTGYDGDDFDGSTVNLAAGIDYRIAENVVLGVLIGNENDDFDDIGAVGSLEGSGFTLGAYAGMQLGGTWVLDGLLSYTWLDYDVSDGTNTGSFDAGRVSAALNLTGSYTLSNGVVFMPGASFLLSSEDQDSYVDSGSNAVSGDDITSGRVSVGTKVAKDYILDSGLLLTPFVSARAEYDFSNADDPVPNSGAPDTGDGFGLRLGAGLDAELTENVDFGLDADLGGIGNSDFTSFSAKASLGVRF